MYKIPRGSNSNRGDWHAAIDAASVLVLAPEKPPIPYYYIIILYLPTRAVVLYNSYSPFLLRSVSVGSRGVAVVTNVGHRAATVMLYVTSK
jgi:hypothetical protein